MTTYSIRPIALCQGSRDVSQYTYCMNLGAKCKSVSYIWYIEGSQPKILVDAGTRAVGGFGDELISVDGGLAKLGLKPEDIDIVIVTHLHLDHHPDDIARRREIAIAFVAPGHVPDLAASPCHIVAGVFHHQPHVEVLIPVPARGLVNIPWELFLDFVTEAPEQPFN